MKKQYQTINSIGDGVRFRAARRFPTPGALEQTPCLPVRQRLDEVGVAECPSLGSGGLDGLDDFWGQRLHQQVVNEPFAACQVEGRFDVIARIHGGGITGQAGALRLGVARCLNEIDEETNRPTLKKAGLLTRDARVIERKKAGLKKARKAPQFSKR